MKAPFGLLVAILVAGCTTEPSPMIIVSDARATTTPRSVAVYLTLVNSGGRDRLLSVDAGEVGPASLHETSMDQDIMRMRAIEGGIEVPRGGQVRLSTNGKHVMIQQLRQPLQPGSTIDLTLRFERQGPVRISPRVEGPR